ncbi:MAG: hypothetical protein ACI4UH_00060 [Dorea sp.]
MLEIIVEKQLIYVLMGIFAAIGVVSKCVANVALKRLIRGAGNMSKSTHPLMRLVRAKFEHACMVSEKVENVHVFVDKFLYEYKVMGVRLYSLRRMETISAVVCLVLGVAGAFLTYSVNGMQDAVIRIGATGGIMAVLLYLFHLTTDENFRMAMVKNYMVDYLENVCLHRYEKAYRGRMEKTEAAEKNNIENDTEDEFEYSDAKPIVGDEVRPEKEVPSPRTSPEIQPEAVPPTRTPTKPEPYDVPDVKQPVRAAEKKENRENKPSLKPEKQDRDVLIRQILEEFMAG